MNRMTDERLAEIEFRVRGVNGTQTVFTESMAVQDRDELLQDLKAEREKVKELEAQKDEIYNEAQKRTALCLQLEKTVKELEVVLRDIYTRNATGDYQKDCFRMKDMAGMALLELLEKQK